jgi:hypothetical protein
MGAARRRGPGAGSQVGVSVCGRNAWPTMTDLSAGNNVPAPHDRGRCQYGARLILGPLTLLSILTLELG